MNVIYLAKFEDSEDPRRFKIRIFDYLPEEHKLKEMLTEFCEEIGEDPSSEHAEWNLVRNHRYAFVSIDGRFGNSIYVSVTEREVESL